MSSSSSFYHFRQRIFGYSGGGGARKVIHQKGFGCIVLLVLYSLLNCEFLLVESFAASAMKNPNRQLPDHLLIGYVDNFDEEDKIIEAVKDGVNVLVWAFFNFNGTTGEIEQPKVSQAVNLIQNKLPSSKGGGDELNTLIHLTSFGGWNGPHLPTSSYSSKDLYDAWVRFNVQSAKGVFDGFDWDLEGNDNIHAKTSVLTLYCLHHMIEMSHLAKKDGYIVGMAPPQSYLDVQSDPTTITETMMEFEASGAPFSTKLNLPPLISPTWHPEFHYTGYNSYAPLLLLHDVIDFVSIQFYETWSRANYEINHQKIDPSTYLVQYIEDLIHRNQGYHVLFTSKDLDHFKLEDDDKGQQSSQLVSKFLPIPVNKLVFGFANGWALNRKDGGAIFIHPSDVRKAFETLRQKNESLVPRGCMFWCIGTEGERGIYLAKELNKIWNNKQQIIHHSPKDETDLTST